MEDTGRERLILFSDAVMAISITLLVLEIRLPPGIASLDGGALAEALAELTPHLMAYGIGFMVIGVFWVSHFRKFRLIERITPAVLWSNLLFLLALCLVPLLTALIAENGGRLATALYAGLLTLCGLLLALVWGAAAASGAVAPEVPRPVRRTVLRNTLLAVAIYALSIPLAFWQADAAKLFWLLQVPLSLFTRHLRSPAPDAIAAEAA